MTDPYLLLAEALRGGVTTGPSAKTWTYSPLECFCDDPDDPSLFCIMAGVHDLGVPYTVESFEVVA